MALWLQAPLWVVITALLLVMAGLGLAEPTLLSVSMGAATKNIGTHSAVLGTAQYLLGALATPLSGLALTFGAPAWGTTVLMVATSALAMAWWGTARPAPPRRATLGAAPSSLTDPEPPAQRDSMNITSD